MSTYDPPPLLRNAHIQSIFSSTGPRKLIAVHHAKNLQENAITVSLPCGNGARLQGKYSAQTESLGLVILIHGWEGCCDSLYMLSSGTQLFKQGYSVFRLNLRDHGLTHHLNRELFNSTRLDEVVGAVKAITEKFPHQKTFLAGFSLGGNFALRVAMNAPEHQIPLDKAVAICPVLNPANTMDTLENGARIYHDYFVLKWQRSLRKKLRFYPELNYEKEFLQRKTLRKMNDYFVPNHTGFVDVNDYLNGYAITGDVLNKLAIESHIIISKDDPIIDASDLDHIARPETLSIELTQYGGHCGYLKNYRLESWLDQRLIELFS